MAARAIQIGETGESVAAAVAAHRQRRGWDQRHLAERVTACGRPMSASVLGKLESGTRRVDIDDLAALAAALDVPPARLLPASPASEAADVTDPFEAATAPGAVRLRVLEDIEALGDLELLDATAPTLAAVAVRLAAEIDAPASPGNSLQGLSKELREVLKELRSLAPEEPDDDDLDDLASPD